MEKDLEKTRALNELSELVKEKEKEENTYIDIPEDINDTVENKEEVFDKLSDDSKTKEMVLNKEKEEIKKNKKNIIKTIKDKWSKLSKKQKIVVGIVAFIILALIIGLIIVLVNHKKEEIEEKKESIVLAKDNYIYKDGFLTILDSNDNTIGTYECDNKDENKCYVAYLSNDEDPFETPINVHEDDEVIRSRSKVYYDRYVFIFDEDDTASKKIKLYDLLNNKVLDEYYGIKSYDVENSNAVILKNDKDLYGLFEFSEDNLKTTIDYKYTFMGLINKSVDDKIVVKDSKGYFLIDYNDKIKSKVKTSEIVDYNDHYIVLRSTGGKYSIVDYSGEEYNKDYDYIRLLSDDYVAVVKGNNLYVRGYSDNKFNEEGLELTNTDYRKIYVFDKDNKLVKTKYSFETELNNKTLVIKILNSDNTSREEKLNLAEGEVSTKYAYYSYFDGKLYFYDDEEKTNIIGEYECHNKNNITGDTFNNCYVAKDTSFSNNYISEHKDASGVIPVFNKRYAFIYDAPDLANDSNIEIKFYDFRDKKSIGTYIAIDADLGEVNDLTLVDTSSKKIIAKLKSGKYGVIEITSNDASVLHKFNYNYIERAKNDFIVQLENNKWQILYGDSSYTSLEFDGKILNYANGYVVAKSGDKANLYKGDGNKIVDQEFDYIDIENNKAFAGVLNKQVIIYNYNGDKINSDVISVGTSNYKSAIKVSNNANYVSVNIYDDHGNLEKAYGPYSIETNNNVDGDNNEG